jgi:hypothetical protein
MGEVMTYRSHRIALVAVICAAIAGCLPAAFPYHYIDAPDAVYLEHPGVVGVPDIAYYPYHGIHIDIYMPSWLVLGIHVPPGATVQLNGNTVHGIGATKTGQFDRTMPLKAAPHGALGSPMYWPKKFAQERDLYTTPDNFGPLVGDQLGPGDAWYVFLSTNALPLDALSGTVALPPMTINGKHYDSQVLQFERRHHAGVSFFGP